MNTKADEFDIELHITECRVSYRGGSIKVDVSELFPDVDDPIMGAYQNYLGGGIAGSIQGGCMFDPRQLDADDRAVFTALSTRIKHYFYSLNEGGGDEYMHENYGGPDAGGYDAVQALPERSY